ncbi:hypothetical protein EZS27_031486 [termite gut metagenome]|uniref:SGNH hydrolase-type esterase domain-containing protein n=1 Tax=termite gut metagenome TaxID=433724 RepID=A0A5J4QD35_9ZZZZ
MKKYIALSIIFCLPVFVGLFALEKIIRKIPNSYQYKNEWMAFHAKDIEALILGSSHTYYGINPEYFSENTFNLANVSQDLERDYFLLNKYINTCPNLRYVLLPVSYFSLFSNLEDSPEGRERLANYTNYMNYNKQNYEFEILNRGGDKLKSYYLFNKDTKACTLYGFGTSYSVDKKNINWKDWQKTVKRHTHSSFERLPENIDYLNKMLQLCKQKNASPILITTPTMPEYYNHLDSIQLRTMYRTIDELKSLNPHLIYYDFLRDSRFEGDDFFDVDHLSNIGAKKFSTMLQEEVQKKFNL